MYRPRVHNYECMFFPGAEPVIVEIKEPALFLCSKYVFSNMSRRSGMGFMIKLMTWRAPMTGCVVNMSARAIREGRLNRAGAVPPMLCAVSGRCQENRNPGGETSSMFLVMHAQFGKMPIPLLGTLF